MGSKFLVVIYLAVSLTLCAQGFLRVDGTKIINDEGEVLLKGIGLGGWLLQEGYMLKTSGFANAEHQIREKIVELIGEEKTNDFYEKYWENYVREIDIQNIADWGFNSIRLPMHYNKLTDLSNTNTYFEKGFQQIDSLLSWCEKYELYLILDLHAAPGGQSDEPISDYNPAFPSLWESETNKEITIKLWRKLSERYADKEWIGGYDLINEPKWELGDDNAPLRQLYIDITNAIREVDTNHIIFIEGNWFATEFTGLTPPWDDNMVYSFHKYWNVNTQDEISKYLTLREQSGKPLWLGETGENSNAWFTECVELMNANNIGWAWWPHKKIDNIAGPLSAPLTPQYQQLLDYWNGLEPKPSADFAYAALLLQAEKLRFENCKFQPDVVDALIRQPGVNTTLPFKQNIVPGKIFAVDYDLGQRGYAYNDTEYQNTTGQPGGAAWNIGGKYRNDGVDIEECSDDTSNGYNIGWTETGEYLKYTFEVQSGGTYDIIVRYAANNSDGQIRFSFDNQFSTQLKPLLSTGGWQNWHSMVIRDIELTAGTHEMIVQFFFGGFNINYFDFVQTVVGVDGEAAPPKYELNQNYPNPFNPKTNIKYQVAETSKVELNVYDTLGQKVETLVNDTKEAGVYEVEFEAENLSGGIYFYKIVTAHFSETKKMLYLK